MWRLLLNPKTLGTAAVFIAIVVFTGSVFAAGKQIERLRGERAALTLQIKLLKAGNKDLSGELKSVKKDLKAVQSEIEDLTKDYDAACVLNDTLIVRYSAFYKKMTGKELKLKDLRVQLRNKK
jgi:chromosome segregation ATPase